MNTTTDRLVRHLEISKQFREYLQTVQKTLDASPEINGVRHPTFMQLNELDKALNEVYKIVGWPSSH